MHPRSMLDVLQAKLHQKSSCLENATNARQMHSQSSSYHHYSLPLTLCNLTQCMVIYPLYENVQYFFIKWFLE